MKEETKKWFYTLTADEQDAINQWIDNNNISAPYILDIIGAPVHLDLEKSDIYLEEGIVYYAQGYEWAKSGYFRDEDDFEDDEYIPRLWTRVGTLQEMLDSYEE